MEVFFAFRKHELNWPRSNKIVKLSFSLFQGKLSTVLFKGVFRKMSPQAILMSYFFF